MICKTSVLTILVLLLNLNLISQDDPFAIEYFDFVRYDLNKIEYLKDSTAFINLFASFDKLIIRGTGKINIVHLGGSHIQAGSLSGRISERLQTFFPGLKGSRGYVFPYNIARTNNPMNYWVRSKGEWEHCKSTNKNAVCRLGLSGISVTTKDTTAFIEIILNDNFPPKYDFNQVKIFHQTDSLSYQPKLLNASPLGTAQTNAELGYTLIRIDRYTDTLKIGLTKTDILQQRFTLYGISLESDEPGVTYHSIGINGASIPCYLRCDLLESHLKALEPDWLVLTLGTNDAYTRSFSMEQFETAYDSLINKIKNAAPDAAILLTVPNDSYLYRKHINRNTEAVRTAIYNLAKKHNCAVWDFYSIMGGLNSISLWYEAGLSSRDKIHFNRRGYYLQADLLFNAFLQSFDNYLEKN